MLHSVSKMAILKFSHDSLISHRHVIIKMSSKGFTPQYSRWRSKLPIGWRDPAHPATVANLFNNEIDDLMSHKFIKFLSSFGL